jgi:hypothetical protein
VNCLRLSRSASVWLIFSCTACINLCITTAVGAPDCSSAP